ncbi:hypothetical protein ACOSQ3_028693 [Xanthoceras sorbifolium]
MDPNTGLRSYFADEKVLVIKLISGQELVSCWWNISLLLVFCLLQINVDAAVDIANKRFGVCIVVCDNSGLLVFAAAQFFYHYLNVESAEARAIQLGVSCACFLQLSKAIIESDALNMVRLCNGVDASIAEVDNIVQDVTFCLV